MSRRRRRVSDRRSRAVAVFICTYRRGDRHCARALGPQLPRAAVACTGLSVRVVRLVPAPAASRRREMTVGGRGAGWCCGGRRLRARLRLWGLRLRRRRLEGRCGRFGGCRCRPGGGHGGGPARRTFGMCPAATGRCRAGGRPGRTDRRRHVLRRGPSTAARRTGGGPAAGLSRRATRRLPWRCAGRAPRRATRRSPWSSAAGPSGRLSGMPSPAAAAQTGRPSMRVRRDAGRGLSARFQAAVARRSGRRPPAERRRPARFPRAAQRDSRRHAFGARVRRTEPTLACAGRGARPGSSTRGRARPPRAEQRSDRFGPARVAVGGADHRERKSAAG